MEKHHRYLVLIEQDEDGIYVASVPALKGCHTQAKSLESVIVRMMVCTVETQSSLSFLNFSLRSLRLGGEKFFAMCTPSF